MYIGNVAEEDAGKQTQPRVRAGKACKRCNQKRVKCDAMFRIPCTNCAQSNNETNCALRQSRRGTYIRKQQHHSFVSEGPQSPGAVDYCSISRPHESDRVGNSQAISAANYPQNRTPDLHSRGPTATTGLTSQSPAEFALELPQSAELSERQTSGETDGNASSYRDISWSTMFDHFLNSRKNSKEFVDKCSITYLGESFPLAIVLEDLNEGGRPKLHHPGPPFPGKEPSTDIPNKLQAAHILPEDLEYLQTKGVFTFPDQQHLDAFIDVFLQRIYPAYPIVSRQELVQQHEASHIPLILLHSICFIAATFCPLSVLHRAGFLSRREARFFYYKKVKLLFDFGYEINKIVILQSAIMMSFWGGGPNNYWNFYSWISTAVTIAEAIGIHRSTATTNMKPQDKSLLRRLWWVLVVRDSACSALVGRPFRIDMDQSDTEMLSIDDFAHDAPSSDCSPYAQYQIEIAKLSLILRDIVMSRFYPGRPQVHPSELHTRLNNWREGLPSNLSWREETDDNIDPFSMTLSIQYDHHLILIYLGHVPSHSGHEYQSEITASAAQNIANIACTVVTKSSVLLVPHELFHGIFMAQAVFYTKLKSTNKLLASLGRSALTNCQMVLHESCECWDPSPWIMQLFDTLSTRLSDRQMPTGDPNYQAAGASEQDGLNTMISSNSEAGVFNGLLGYDPWQSNPMLSSLFDFPTEMLLPQ
ncbi:fungal-specific transcription factor domain-containing protein [Aspergillus ambiguus]|uniref:Zn(II)2Cys6 transcription factor n=1 Tax=Aspergillus ambiguus TaxID=176160 RepID=UPI003CCCD130